VTRDVRDAGWAVPLAVAAIALTVALAGWAATGFNPFAWLWGALT
jgi:hypothetical protein